MKSLAWLLAAAAVPLLTQCAKPAPPKPEWTFDASIVLTPEALASLKGDNALVTEVYYYGRIAPGSHQEPDALGRVRLGDHEFETHSAAPRIHATGVDIDQSLLGDIVNGEVNVQITAHSNKERGPDDPPYVECNSYDGTIAMARAKPPVIICGKYRP